MENKNKHDSGILQLPSDVTDIIFGDDSLSSQDICSVSQTCTQLRGFCQSNEVWKRKLQQRWPKLLNRYQRNQQYDWLIEYKTCHMIEQKVQMLLRNMSPTYYKLEDLSRAAYADFILLMEEHNSGEIIINNLMELIHSEDKNNNLTIKHYAAKVLRYILHRNLSEKWKEYISNSSPCSDQQKFEDGAVLLAQWCQPNEDITQNAISDQLDSIAKVVIQNLPLNLSSEFKEDSVPPSWNPQQERVVLETLNHTLFNVLSYFYDKTDYYDENNSYIDKVLKSKSGVPGCLSVIYISLARRLGVALEFVDYRRHVILKWKEHPTASIDDQFTYLDPLDKGKFIPDSDIDKIPELIQAVPPVKVKEQLQSLMSHDQSTNGLISYLVKSADEQMIELEEKRNSKNPPKRRIENKEVEFSVGMVMKHKKYDFLCIIYSWDSRCQESKEWIKQMGIRKLQKKDQQPFYNVLVEDGSISYEAQENLVHPPSGRDIPNPNIGKYFQRFTGQFYVPNNEIEKDYPDDTEFTQTQVTEVSLGRLEV